LIFWLKKLANSLHFSVERRSGFNCLGGFVSFSKIANRVWELLAFLLISSDKCSCLALHSSLHSGVTQACLNVVGNVPDVSEALITYDCCSYSGSNGLEKISGNRVQRACSRTATCEKFRHTALSETGEWGKWCSRTSAYRFCGTRFGKLFAYSCHFVSKKLKMILYILI